MDRGARTQQVTFLIPNEEKEAYLGSEPADDARFVDSIAHTLEHAGGYAPEEAKQLAEPMLPDILPYDPTRPVAYPDNGRLFTDDVGDRLVAILTTGRKTGKRRTSPLLYLADVENLVVVASKGGALTHPVWWLKLQANPEATVEIGRRKVRVRAEVARGEKKHRLWASRRDVLPLRGLSGTHRT